MAGKGRRVVWILGSGFSKSLGGPLLPDLLSHRGQAYQRAKFTNLDQVGSFVYATYWHYLRDAPENRGYPVYWDHAEEFLEFVSSAETTAPRRSILTGILNERAGATDPPDLATFARVAIQCVAAECLFTGHANPVNEAWRPYVEWGRNVGVDDTIISFNYDMVLETLGNSHGDVRFGDKSVVKPTEPMKGEHAGVPVLKLHGSVGWFKLERGAAYAAESAGAEEQLRGAGIPWIATPGPDKLLLQESDLKSLWEKAKAALSAASVIVFMGYRFPPSDSQARSELLGAIKANKDAKYLRVHTVLGPRITDDHTSRLANILEQTLTAGGRKRRREDRPLDKDDPPTFSVIKQPLYVEDFLTVVHDQDLYGY